MIVACLGRGSDCAPCSLRAGKGERDGHVLASVTQYVHGYGTPEQERLVEQAEHWRHRLIADGTHLEPGTRLLEVGTGVGAVLAVLGQEFPGIRLTGVDIEPKQLEFARGHLERSGVEATWSKPTRSLSHSTTSRSTTSG